MNRYNFFIMIAEVLKSKKVLCSQEDKLLFRSPEEVSNTMDKVLKTGRNGNVNPTRNIASIISFYAHCSTFCLI